MKKNLTTEQIKEFDDLIDVRIEKFCSQLLQHKNITKKDFSGYFAEYTSEIFFFTESYPLLAEKLISSIEKLSASIVFHCPMLSKKDSNNRYSLKEEIQQEIEISGYFFYKMVKDYRTFKDNLKNVVTSCYPIKNEILYTGDMLDAFNKLCEATKKGNSSRMNYLIEEYNLDVNAHNGKALLSAIEYNKKRSVAFLLDKGIDISVYYFTPLVTVLKNKLVGNDTENISELLTTYITHSGPEIEFNLKDIKIHHQGHDNIYKDLYVIDSYKKINNNLSDNNICISRKNKI